MSKVNIKAIEMHFRIPKSVHWLEQVTILLNSRPIAFIESRSLFFITQLDGRSFDKMIDGIR